MAFRTFIEILVVFIVVYAVFVEAFWVRLTRLRLECPRLPIEFEGFTILQISDLHMGNLGRRERGAHRAAYGLKPDITVLTGDLAFHDVAARDLMKIVRGAGAKEGTFAISGNSDVRHPVEWAAVKRVLTTEGVQLLENQHVVMERSGARIVVAGVDDPHTGLDDLPQALNGAPRDAFTLLLAHSPAIAVPAIEMGMDVVLSGHTHGGQLVLPFIGPLMTRSGHGKDLASGLFKGSKLRRIVEVDPGITQLYISRGIGASFLPMRFLCPPEVTLIELARPAA